MTKLSAERMWFLRRWEQSGWAINLRSGKKWEAHLSKLTKDGLLEHEHGMYRITEAGRLTLKGGRDE